MLKILIKIKFLPYNAHHRFQQIHILIISSVDFLLHFFFVIYATSIFTQINLGLLTDVGNVVGFFVVVIKVLFFNCQRFRVFFVCVNN